jgi:hypothetical protein
VDRAPEQHLAQGRRYTVSDWNAEGPEGEGPGVDDLLSDLDWSAEPAGAAEVPVPAYAVQEEPIQEPAQEPMRRSSSAARRQGNHSMDRGVSRGAFWGFLVLALVIGLGTGLGVVVWQRAALTSDIRALETKLATAEASATATAQQLQDLEARLASSDASMTELAAQNMQLAADLAAAKTALAAAVSSGTITITERAVSPTSVVASHTLTLSVKVQGKADKVQMRIVGQSGITYSQTFNLTKSSTSGDIVTWKRSVTAPSKKGTYRYYATAYVGTKKFEMPGVSAWTFVVK